MKDAKEGRVKWLRAARIFVGGYCLLVALLGCASVQRKLIYFPPVLDSSTVAEAAHAENLEPWKGPDGKLIGWQRLCASQPAVGHVVIFHGNGDGAFQCAHYADTIQQVAALDVYILEYPGYADRPGKPSEHSLYAAADEAADTLPTNRPTYLIGESLGTGVATYLAARRPELIAGIVLLGAYTKFADVAHVHYPWLPVRLLLYDRFPSEDYLRQYHGPVAMVVAGNDRVVPPDLGRGLYHGYAGPKRIWDFPGQGHGDVMTQPPEIWAQILIFLGIPPLGTTPRPAKFSSAKHPIDGLRICALESTHEIHPFVSGSGDLSIHWDLATFSPTGSESGSQILALQRAGECDPGDQRCRLFGRRFFIRRTTHGADREV